MRVLPDVEIFCDGNKKIGFGHIRRAKTLAHCLENYGVSVQLFGLSEYSRSMLPVKEFNEGGARVAIFDAPNGIEDRIRLSNKLGQITVTLDWFGAETPDFNIVNSYKLTRYKLLPKSRFSNVS